MLPPKTSFVTTWGSPTSQQGKGKSTWVTRTSAHSRCSCAALSGKWGTEKASGGCLSTSSRVEEGM
ncbi:unnamed protein product [Linum tenue]|uniref:Uncharacterized protein n=1 Tax=Linum tenue TaxID=586396 RepID=A0AAV0MIP4_9ROSI|nr:unnamed protein product [Linum tenue]CAI0551683.1 unnamed protein product [Linum tenue]